MRIKDLFTVPAGAKVTEKMFGRVMISSICSIVLCMACMAGTSWAWFTAGIESADNVIQIAPATLETRVMLGSQPVNPNDDDSFSLPAGEYQLQLTLDRGEDPQSTAYVLVAVRHTVPQDLFFTFPGNADKEQTIDLTVTEGTANINFRVTWICPDRAQAIRDGDTVTVGQLSESVADAAGEPTEATEETTEATEPTEEIQPEETTGSTQPATEPVSSTDPETTLPDTTQPQAEETQPLQSTIDIA